MRQFLKMKQFVALSLCLSALLSATDAQETGPVGTFVRTNIIGFPVIHDEQSWIFDPDVAQRRRKQFFELHGDKAEKLIERLGLGIDGYEDQRLQVQRQRDEGHLNGLNSLLP